MCLHFSHAYFTRAMRKYFALLLTLLSFNLARSQRNAIVTEYQKVFPTYPFSDPNPIPLLTQVYPYYRFDGFTDKAVNKQWKVVQLENDYIQLLILPEIGGKIWAAIDKKTNTPFLYYNHTVKFRDVAMRGPWTSGGLEANFGIIGHTPNCATPVDYITRSNADGSVSCIIGVLDLLTRSNWRVEINLPKDKAYFTTQAFWYNSTPAEQPYYHWMNAGVKAGNDLEFIYRGNQYIGHGGEHAAWPTNEKNGKQINWYKENNFGGYKSYHVFGKYTNFFGTYYHDEDQGMARYSTHDDKAGKKIWIWGLSRQGMIWEKLLTDTDGQYVEVQSGRLFNQNAEQSTFTPFKHVGFEPYTTDTWKEYWYPVSQTKGFVEANEYGALNVKYEDGWLKLHFYPVQAIHDSLVVKNGDNLIYKQMVDRTPMQVFADSVKTTADTTSNLHIALGMNKLTYNTNPNAYTLSRPTDTPKDFDWNSAYGLYIQGSELMDEKMYDKAEDKLSAALQKDSSFLPAVVQMAQLLYRNMQYKEALQLAKQALSINTEAGDANFYYGLISEQLGNTIDAKDGYDIAALTPGYRSAAYTQLASLYFKENNLDKALHYAQKAAAYNGLNMAALQMEALIFRYQHNQAAANTVLDTMLSFDPINHFALFEKYNWQNTEQNKQNFTTTIRNEMPQETYAELATWYYKNGCTREATQLFQMSPTSTEANIWLAFLQNKKPDDVSLDPALYFPFRSETAATIDSLLQHQDNWELKYFLALVYHDRNRLEECKQLLMDCGNIPSYAPFYAARAAIVTPTDSAQGLADLQKALSLDKHWRYYKLLGEYYNAHNQSDKALLLLQPYYKAHPDDYIMGLLYAKTLLLNKQYSAADQVLAGLNIIPFEGATAGHELYHEAKLMQAAEALRKKNYTKSLALIEQSKEWPEHLGSGKPYDADMDTRLEDWMSYLNYRRMSNTAKANAALNNILLYTNNINKAENVNASNAIISLWAFNRLNKQEEGRAWINNEIKDNPDNQWLQWSKQMSDQPTITDWNNTVTNTNITILKALSNE